VDNTLFTFITTPHIKIHARKIVFNTKKYVIYITYAFGQLPVFQAFLRLMAEPFYVCTNVKNVKTVETAKSLCEEAAP
jgi:hypothetical protein